MDRFPRSGFELEILVIEKDSRIVDRENSVGIVEGLADLIFVSSFDLVDDEFTRIVPINDADLQPHVSLLGCANKMRLLSRNVYQLDNCQISRGAKAYQRDIVDVCISKTCKGPSVIDKTIVEAASLQALPLNDDDPKEIEFAHGNAAGGMGGEGEPAQLDIVWANGRTLVYPAKVPDGFTQGPWAFEGEVNPQDCVAWLRAKMKADEAQTAGKPTQQ